jgi:hypothetical protein
MDIRIKYACVRVKQYVRNYFRMSVCDHAEEMTSQHWLWMTRRAMVLIMKYYQILRPESKTTIPPFKNVGQE